MAVISSQNGFDFQITGADGLRSGENTLTIAAYQGGGGPFGVLGPSRITLLASCTKRKAPQLADLLLVGRRLKAEVELVEGFTKGR
jgi:hypothetical protein